MASLSAQLRQALFWEPSTSRTTLFPSAFLPCSSWTTSFLPQYSHLVFDSVVFLTIPPSVQPEPYEYILAFLDGT